MSYSQFDDSNPYRQTAPQFQPNTPASNSGSSTQFIILGILFILLAIVSLGGSVLAVVGGVVQYVDGKAVPPPNAEAAERTGFYIGFFGFVIIGGVSGLLQPLIAWAGINMLRGKGLGIAKLGAILMCIPFLTSCCLLGTPFGIWGIIALNSDSAKQHFGLQQITKITE